MYEVIETPTYADLSQQSAIIDEIARLRKVTNNLTLRLDKIEGINGKEILQ